MGVEAYLNGIFPRSDLALEAGSSWLKGRETKENFYRILEKETKEIIELQQDLGFNYIIDGQLFWDDFLRPIASALGLNREKSNADENPVTRQIYTNTFYRKPFISGRLNDFNKGINKEIEPARLINTIQKGKRKAILPSPFALVYLSDGIHWNEKGMLEEDIFVELLFDAAKILNQEAKRLEKDFDVSFVQFNDPCMAYAEESKFFWDDIARALQIAINSRNVITSLHLYNGDASKFLPDLPELPVDRIGIDPYTTNLRNFVDIGFKKFLEIGVINSKNSLIENPETIAKYAQQAMEKIAPEGLALAPNRPLELVPREIAIKKMESLAKAVQILKEKARIINNQLNVTKSENDNK